MPDAIQAATQVDANSVTDSALILSITNLIESGDYTTAHSLTRKLGWRAALQQTARIRAAERAAQRQSDARYELAEGWRRGQSAKGGVNV